MSRLFAGVAFLLSYVPLIVSLYFSNSSSTACDIWAALISSRLAMFGPSSIHSPFSRSFSVSMAGGRPFHRFSQFMVHCVRQWKDEVGVLFQFRVISVVVIFSIEDERFFDMRM